MAICAYCGNSCTPTREHIIPSWFYSYKASPDDMGFMDRARAKVGKFELSIRDVCADCNNGALSDLDDYGKSLFHDQLLHFPFADSTPTLSYSYDNLVRWLLKVSFNSARANSTDLEILNQYPRIILGKEELPAHLFVGLSTIAPTSEDDQLGLRVAKTTDEVISYPEWFRVGVFRMKHLDSINWSFRQVVINAYAFMLYVPDLSTDDARAELEDLMSAQQRQAELGVILPRSNSVKSPSPLIDAISYNMHHIGQFPLAYGATQNGTLRTAIKEDYKLVTYVIDRADVEAGHIGNIMDFLSDLISSREIAMSMNGRVEFLIHGYDDDPREVFEIPELVAFLAKVDGAWPYWMLFQHPDKRWLQVLNLCLSNAKRSASETIDFDATMYGDNMTRWFVGLNELSHKFAITLAINKAVSERANAILMQGLS